MNIVYVGAFRLPNLDAAAPRVLNNAKALRQLGHDVKFISWGGQYRESDLCEDGKYRVSGFEYQISGDLPINNTIRERILTKVNRGKRSIKLLERISKIDLIIIYNADRSFTDRMLHFCKKNHIKLANDINEWYDNKELHLLDILPNHINMTHTQHKVRNKIVISSFLNNYYKESNNILVPPLCDPDELKWKNSIDDDRINEFNGITLIYAGNPARKDCIHYVINAVNTLANGGAAIRFLILGTTYDLYRKIHPQSFENISLHKNIIFLGRVSQVLIPAYYKKADFMVLLRNPNRKSMAGFPTKVAESMIAGIPVITNTTSDLPKYVVNGKTGFIVDGYDYDSILSTFTKSVLTLTKSDIQQMKRNVQCSNGDFDWHTQIRKFKIFIDNLK